MIQETCDEIYSINYRGLDDLITELQKIKERLSTKWKNISVRIESNEDADGYILYLIGEREETVEDLQRKLCQEQEERLKRQLLYLELEKEFGHDA